MGTSQSSKGPGGGVPMVPPWTPPPPGDEAPDVESEDEKTSEESISPSPLAPPARFLGCRKALGDFARSGDSHYLRRSFGHYVRTGYGGSTTATRRFGATATTAGVLGEALANLAADMPAAPEKSLDRALLAGRNAQEIMDAIVEVVRPVDGTQDAEAGRAAIRDALSDLLARFPNADLLDLDPIHRAFAVERFAAIDVYRRFELDVGKMIVEKAPSVATAMARLKEAKDYVKEIVAAAFRKILGADQSLTSGRIGQIVRSALKETFEVFEGYVE